MSKKAAKTKSAPAAKPAEDGAPEAAPKKRSKLKLALVALVPLLLAGGGYAGWSFFMAPGADEAHAEAAAEGEEGHGEDGHGAADMMKVSSVETALKAETSATHTYALSVLIAGTCGASRTPALKAASDAEAAEDGMLVSLSWQGAARRAMGVTEKACNYMVGEIEEAELKLAPGADAAKGGHGAPAKDDGGHAKPAH